MTPLNLDPNVNYLAAHSPKLDIPEWKKSLGSFAKETSALGSGLVALGAQALGAQEARDSALADYQRNMEEASSGWLAPEVGQIEDIRFTEQGGAGRLGAYLGYQVPKGIAQLGSLVAGGLGIGTLARTVANKEIRNLAKQEVKNMAAELAAKGAATAVATPLVERVAGQEAIKQLAKRQILGTQVGVGAGALGMETGQIYGKLATDPTVGPEAAVGPSLAYGGVAAALEYLPLHMAGKAIGLDRVLLRKVIKEDVGLAEQATKLSLKKRALGVAGKVVGGAAAGAATEGITEGMQNLVEQAATKYAQRDPQWASILPTTKEGWSEFWNSAAAGAAVGGVAGAALGPLTGAKPQDRGKVDEETTETQTGAGTGAEAPVVPPQPQQPIGATPAEAPAAAPSTPAAEVTPNAVPMPRGPEASATALEEGTAAAPVETTAATAAEQTSEGAAVVVQQPDEGWTVVAPDGLIARDVPTEQEAIEIRDRENAGRAQRGEVVGDTVTPQPGLPPIQEVGAPDVAPTAEQHQLLGPSNAQQDTSPVPVHENVRRPGEQGGQEAKLPAKAGGEGVRTGRQAQKEVVAFPTQIKSLDDLEQAFKAFMSEQDARRKDDQGRELVPSRAGWHAPAGGWSDENGRVYAPGEFVSVEGNMQKTQPIWVNIDAADVDLVKKQFPGVQITERGGRTSARIEVTASEANRLRPLLPIATKQLMTTDEAKAQGKELGKTWKLGSLKQTVLKKLSIPYDRLRKDFSDEQIWRMLDSEYPGITPEHLGKEVGYAYSDTRLRFTTNENARVVKQGDGYVIERLESRVEPVVPDTDSTGKLAHPTPEGRENFKKWFAGSKIVDEKGQPLRVYHRGQFDEQNNPIPDIGNEGFHFGTKSAADERPVGKLVDDPIKGMTVEQEDGRWFWQFDDGTSSYDFDEEGFDSESEAREDGESVAQSQAENYDWDEADYPLTEAWVSIKNPKRVTDQAGDWTATIRQAKAEGYDGIVYRNEFEDRGKDSYIVFSPDQIKSATGNRGTFEQGNPNILESRTSAPTQSTTDFVAQVDSVLGQGWTQRAIDAGILTINETSPADSASGYFEPSTGKLVVNLDRIPQGQSPIDVLLHEGSHASMARMLGKQFEGFHQDLERLANNGSATAKSAILQATKGAIEAINRQRAEPFPHRLGDETLPVEERSAEIQRVRDLINERDPGLLLEEDLAYYVQLASSDNPAEAGFWRRLLAAIQAWIAQTNFGKAMATIGWRPELSPQLAVELAKQAAQATLRRAETVNMLLGERAKVLRSLPAAAQLELLESDVWHAGPNPWEPEPGFPRGRPRLDKVGTGEGGQLFGWGWYSAENEEVSGPEGQYAKTFSNMAARRRLPAYSISGKKIPRPLTNLEKQIVEDAVEQKATLATVMSIPEQITMFEEDVAALTERLKALNVEVEQAQRPISERLLRARNEVRSHLAEKEKDIDSFVYARKLWPLATANEYISEYYAAKAKLVEEFGSGYVTQIPPIAAIYRLNIPDADIQRMLQWDKPLSEQTEEVRRALKKAVDAGYIRSLEVDNLLNSESRRKFSAPYNQLNELQKAEVEDTVKFMYGEATPDLTQITGAQLYGNLEQKLPHISGEHPKKKVSEYLRSLGIVGNKYLDYGSRSDKKWKLEGLIDMTGSTGSWKPSIDFFNTKEEAETFARKYNWKDWDTSYIPPTYNYVIWDQDVLDRVGTRHLDWQTGEILESRPSTISASWWKDDKVDEAAIADTLNSLPFSGWELPRSFHTSPLSVYPEDFNTPGTFNKVFHGIVDRFHYVKDKSPQLYQAFDEWKNRQGAMMQEIQRMYLDPLRHWVSRYEPLPEDSDPIIRTQAAAGKASIANQAYVLRQDLAAGRITRADFDAAMTALGSPKGPVERPSVVEIVGHQLAARHILLDDVTAKLALKAAPAFLKELKKQLSPHNVGLLNAEIKLLTSGSIQISKLSTADAKKLFELYLPNANPTSDIGQRWTLWNRRSAGYSIATPGSIEALSDAKDGFINAHELYTKQVAARGTFQKIAELSDRLAAHQLGILQEGGLLEPADVAWLGGAYPHYVPLRREAYDYDRELAEMFEKPKANIGKLMAREGAIASETASAVHVLQNHLAAGFTAASAAARNQMMNKFADVLYQDPKGWKPWFYIRPEKVHKNDIGFVRGGKTLYIVPAEGNLRAASIIKVIAGKDAQELSGPLKVMRMANNWIRWSNVSASPAFMLTNVPRDYLTSRYNLKATEAAAYAKEIGSLANYKESFKALKMVLVDGVRTSTDPKVQGWIDLVEDFEKAGGKTSFVEALRAMDGDSWKSFEAQVGRRQGKKGAVVEWGRDKLEWLENLNITLENVMRLSTYKVMRDALQRDMGMTPETAKARAAEIARNLTTNFTRRGAHVDAINTWWLFYNATVQGNWQVIQNLFFNPNKAGQRRLQKAVGGTILLAFMVDQLGRAFSDDEDDDGVSDWDSRTAYDKERKISSPFKDPVTGGYLSIPAPWVFNIFWRLGGMLGEVKDGVLKPQDAVLDSIALTMNAMDPVGGFKALGGEGTMAQSISPTAFDPIMQMIENRDFRGNPLGPDGYPGASKRPDAYLAWDSTPQGFSGVAQFVNEVTGGSAMESGKVDWRPSSYKVLWDTLLGGVGRTAIALGELGISPFTEKTEFEGPEEVPLVKTFLTAPNDSTAISLYHDRVAQVLGAKRLEKLYSEGIERNPQKLAEVRQDRAAALRMVPQVEDVERQIAALRKTLRSAQARDDSRTEEQLRDRIVTLQKRFNQSFNRRVSNL